MSLDSVFCVYTTAFSSNDTYLKKRCVGWLDDSNIIFGLYKSNAGSYTQNDPLSTTALMCTMFWPSFRIVSSIFDEISSLKHLLLSFTGLKIDKIQYMTLIVPTSTLTIACQHMLEHTKAFNFGFSDSYTILCSQN